MVRSIRSIPTTCFATRGVELFENAKKSYIENASHVNFSEISRLLKVRKDVNDFDQRSLSRTSFNIRIPHPLCASWLRRSRLTETLLTQERVQIASDQKLEADALNTAGQVRDRGGHVLGEEKLASTLNVMPSATFRGPSSADQYRRHLIAA